MKSKKKKTHPMNEGLHYPLPDHELMTFWRRAMLFFHFSIFYCILLPAQDQPDHFYDLDNKRYYISYLSDAGEIAISSGSWKGKDWAVFGALTATGAVIYLFDRDIHSFVQDNRTATSDRFSKYFADPLSNGLYTIPVLGIFYASGALGNNRHQKNIALTGLKAFLLGGGAAFITKNIFQRHRPDQDEPPDPYLWEGPFSGGWEYNSFPSAHTTMAFAVASVISAGYKDKAWVGISSYTLATLAGISRVNESEHWLSDVFAGAILGTYIGSFSGRKYLPGTRTGMVMQSGIPSFYVGYIID